MKGLSILAVTIVLLAGCALGDQVTQGEVSQKEELQENSKVRASYVEEGSKAKKKKKKNTQEQTKDQKDLAEESGKQEDAGEETEEQEGGSSITAADDTFDYVALGNSVTYHEINELWWGNWGMAATTEENDYVHIVSRWLDSQSARPVTTTILDLEEWEVASDRVAALDDYDEYFSEYTDLVTLQTGENITEGRETLERDYLALLQRIKEKAPNAQILMLGEVLWPKDDIEAAKQAACEQTGITFIDVSDFRKKYEKNKFRSAMGGEVYGADGNIHIIDNEVVAAHPNDKGMKNIAQHFIDNIVITDLVDY